MNRYDILHALTNLGDSVITLPIAVMMLVWLWVWGNKRTALSWVVALIACGAVTAVLKIYFKACPVPDVELNSPSGHTSMSLFIYGGLTLVTVALTRGWLRAATWALGILLILAIAASRVVLNFHSQVEVVIGVGIGSAALFLFWAGFQRYRPAHMPLWPLWVPALIPIILLDGRQFSSEGLLVQIALYIRNVIDFCA